MNCTLTRSLTTLQGVFGSLISEDASFGCVTAEHSYDGIPKVPIGVYRCIRRQSPKFGFDVFMLTDVSNAQFIEIHPGNYPQQDSDGCILLGEQREGMMITNSRVTFDKFMQMQSRTNEFTLTVK